MKFQILKQIGARYRGEQGTRGHRNALKDLEADLQKAIAAADRAKKFAREKQVADIPAGPGSVKALAKFHTQQQNKQLDVERLNAAVIHLRQWLHRQNGILTPDGHIIWPKSDRVVLYDSDLAKQNATRLTVGGSLLYTAQGKPLDTSNMVTHFSGPGYAIYVMSQEGHLHVTSHSVGERHHSSLLAGLPVACAGELIARGGRLQLLTNKSGHYVPNRENLLQVLAALDLQGVPLDFRITCLKVGGEAQYPNTEAFLRGEHLDNNALESLKMLAVWLRAMLSMQDGTELEELGLQWTPPPNSSSKLGLGTVYDTRTNPPRALNFAELSRILRETGFRQEV